MQLVRILLVAASVVVLLSGLSILFGSPKQEKSSALRFLLAAFGACIWTVAIIIFLHMPNASDLFARIIVTCIIGGVTLCDIGLLAYLGWQYKHGKGATFLFAAVGIVLVALLAYDPSLFYTNIDLSQEYTILYVNHGWFYYALIAYFFSISIVFSGFLQKRIKSTTNKGLKNGLKVFYIGLSIGGILALIFNLILITSNPNLVWIGPMATIISIMSFYYSVVRFRTITLSSKWMEILSSAILITTAVIIYLLAFYAVFSALFGIPNPSIEVLLLNIIMAVLLLLLTPALTELTNFMKANYYLEKIDLGYVEKKLENISKSTFDARDIAKFLADTMHYDNIAIILNEHYYPSDETKLTTEEVERLSNLQAENNEKWIISKKELSNEHGISKIGILTNKHGKVIGKIVFGKHLSDQGVSRRDEIKQEEILGILSCMIEDFGKAK